MHDAHYTEKAVVAIRIEIESDGGGRRLVIVIGWRRGRESEHNIISSIETREGMLFPQVDALQKKGGKWGGRSPRMHGSLHH